MIIESHTRASGFEFFWPMSLSTCPGDLDSGFDTRRRMSWAMYRESSSFFELSVLNCSAIAVCLAGKFHTEIKESVPRSWIRVRILEAVVEIAMTIGTRISSSAHEYTVVVFTISLISVSRSLMSLTLCR